MSFLFYSIQGKENIILSIHVSFSQVFFMFRIDINSIQTMNPYSSSPEFSLSDISTTEEQTSNEQNTTDEHTSNEQTTTKEQTSNEQTTTNEQTTIDEQTTTETTTDEQTTTETTTDETTNDETVNAYEEEQDPNQDETIPTIQELSTSETVDADFWKERFATLEKELELLKSTRSLPETPIEIPSETTEHVIHPSLSLPIYIIHLESESQKKTNP